MTNNQARVAVVTGAAGGMGRALCERLARHGWKVVAADVDANKLQWVDGNDSILAYVVDVTSAAENQALLDTAERHFGGVDAVVLNAAVTTLGTIESTPLEEFDRLIAVNVMGVVHGMRAGLPALRRRGGGAVLVTSSLHGLAGETLQSAYSATKHAVLGLVRCTARDVGHEGIRVNAICPGTTRATGMTDALEIEAPAAYRALQRSVPLQRWAEPDELAAVMEFLISPESSYVNGVAMPVDGGVICGSGLLPPTASAGAAHG